MEMMYVNLRPSTNNGPMRLGTEFGEISNARAIEIAKLIIELQTPKVPVAAGCIGQWNELVDKVKNDLNELCEFAEKMETLAKLDGSIQEKTAKAQSLEREIENLKAEIQQVQHEQEDVKEALEEVLKRTSC